MIEKNPLENRFTTHPLKKELEMAVAIALDAGNLIQGIRTKGYKVYEKEDNQGQVTDADQAINSFLLDQIRSIFPNDAIVSEEAPPIRQAAHQNRIWFIDPIDGTKEFIGGSNEWAIMIGLAMNSRPCLGVVYQPDLNQIYFALKGGGAYFSTGDTTKRIQVRTVSDPSQAVLIQSRSHFSMEADSIAQKLGIIKILKQGSLGLKLGIIATGKADLYFNLSGHCHLWDLCAPEAILQEAGGKVRLASGKKILYGEEETVIKERFLATNTELLTTLYQFLT